MRILILVCVLKGSIFVTENERLPRYPLHLLRLAMQAGSVYEVLRHSIYTHPSMTESLNDFFSWVRLETA